MVGKFSHFLPCDEWMRGIKRPEGPYSVGRLSWAWQCHVWQSQGGMSRRSVVTLLVCHNILYCIGKMFRPQSQVLWSLNTKLQCTQNYHFVWNTKTPNLPHGFPIKSLFFITTNQFKFHKSIIYCKYWHY